MLFIGNLGTSEIIILIVVLIIVIGPGKMPDAARNAGKWFRKIRRAGDDIKSKIESEIFDDREDYASFQEKTTLLEASEQERSKGKAVEKGPGEEPDNGAG